jgi:hypothetical protein
VLRRIASVVTGGGALLFSAVTLMVASVAASAPTSNVAGVALVLAIDGPIAAVLWWVTWRFAHGEPAFGATDVATDGATDSATDGAACAARADRPAEAIDERGTTS